MLWAVLFTLIVIYTRRQSLSSKHFLRLAASKFDIVLTSSIEAMSKVFKPKALLYFNVASTFQDLSTQAKRLPPGVLLLFDELVNYPKFDEHEALALWEFMVLFIWVSSTVQADSFRRRLSAKLKFWHFSAM